MPLDRLTKLDPLQLGRFTILARLGGGGMGNVYLAEGDDGTPAAVKVIRAELAQDPQFRARFRREVEAGRRVQNRCIARYLDADTFAPSPWLATEFVPGPTLHHEVYGRGPIVGPRVMGLAAGLADALVAIHAAGLVHRDLKPANVLLAPDAPKVIDFGISLAADATVLTTTGTLVGSPAYMSPEQARGVRDVGPPADVFSWASCVTFANRREPPFGEGEAAGLLYKVVHEEPSLFGLAPALLPLVLAALDKEPENRPTALELVAGITAILDGAPPASVLAPPGLGPSRVLVPTGGANAGRVLLATWAPDHAAVEEAERMLAQARELRASLPARAEERSRRDRARAKRAIFVAMLAALVALVVVVIVTVRPGQEELAEPADTGLGADPTTTSTTQSGGGVTSVPAPPGSVATNGYGTAPPGPATTVVTTVAPPAGAAATPATTTSAPTAAPTVVPGPITTQPPGCTTTILEPAPGTTDQLPKDVPYRVRIRAGRATPSGDLVLVRQPSTGVTPADRWTEPAPALSSGQELVSQPHTMTGLPGADSSVVHHEPAGARFELQLRVAGRPPVSCGQLRGYS